MWIGLVTVRKADIMIPKATMRGFYLFLLAIETEQELIFSSYNSILRAVETRIQQEPKTRIRRNFNPGK